MPRMRIPAGLRPWLPLLVLLTLLGAAAAAYYPGLSGPFLLDDWSTLPKLGAYGPVDNPVTFVSYVTDGVAGPTGRPLALAAFLIDAHGWPANPWPFKLTNVLLHLLNGVLLAALLVRLSRRRGLGPERAAWAGVLGAALWLLHPLFVSTTLYVVQRMTEMGALFVFAGLILWERGRSRLEAGRTRSGYAWMLAGLGGGALLGALSKENALLLPVFLLVLEATVLRRPVGPARGFRVFKAAFLWLPAAAIFAYLALPLTHAIAPIQARDFTLLQRLGTEPRVLAQYLYLLVIPHAGTGGLFHTLTPSTGPFTPWTTLPAAALILALVAFGFAVRRRWPALAAAVLFYFAGQLLESTTVPLELFFEHRNYLPAALLFWPLALWAVRGPGSRALRTATIGAALLVLAALTFLRASLWGNGLQLSLTWMRLNPASPRALVLGTEALTAAGRPGLALAKLRAAGPTMPDDVSVALSRLDLACELGDARRSDLAAAVRAAGRDRVDADLIYKDVARLARRSLRHPCPPVTPASLAAVPEAALTNPHYAPFPAERQQFLVLEGRLALLRNDPESAYGLFARALPLDPKPETALVAAALLYSAHAPRRGLELLDEYRGLRKRRPRGWTMAHLHRLWLDHIGWYRESFRRVRGALEAEVAAKETTR